MRDETLPSWQALYKAALFETDLQRLPFRIQEARRAALLRSHELFSMSLNYDGEAEAIEAALYGLNALDTCVKLKTKDRRRTPRTA